MQFDENLNTVKDGHIDFFEKIHNNTVQELKMFKTASMDGLELHADFAKYRAKTVKFGKDVHY